MYRELSIVTARPSADEEAQTPHRLYGTLSASENCSAGSWLNLARMEIDWVLQQGGRPIVVGGTGLYIRALLQGIADIPDIDPQVRAQARSDMTVMGNEAFHERLKAVDPALGGKLRVSDTQRLVRAYEVWLGTGKPLSWWQQKDVSPPYPKDYFAIYQMEIDRELLYRRCDARFLAMMEQGALEEVRRLLAMHLPPDLPAMKSVGVPELAAHIKGDLSLEEAVATAQQATRHYAKRQLTWLRHQLSDFETNPLTAAVK